MKRGKVWLVNLEPTIGGEMQKMRPAVIVNNDRLAKLPLKVIVPITDWKESYTAAPWIVRITPDEASGSSKISAADCFQVRSVSEMRCVKRLGVCSEDVLLQIQRGLSRVLM